MLLRNHMGLQNNFHSLMGHVLVICKFFGKNKTFRKKRARSLIKIDNNKMSEKLSKAFRGLSQTWILLFTAFMTFIIFNVKFGVQLKRLKNSFLFVVSTGSGVGIPGPTRTSATNMGASQNVFGIFN